MKKKVERKYMGIANNTKKPNNETHSTYLLRIPKSTYKKIKIKVAMEDTNIGSFLNSIIRKHVN